MQGIEGVEKLLLDGLTVGDELDVVDHEDIHIAEAMPELRVLTHANGFYKLIGKGFAGHVQDPGRGIILFHGVADGMHQMGLAQALFQIQMKKVFEFEKINLILKIINKINIFIINNFICNYLFFIFFPFFITENNC